MATPPGKAHQLIRHQTVASGRAVGLAAEVARYWIEGDAADRILGAIIAENGARRAMALEVLAGHEVQCAPHAPFLWLKLPEAVDSPAISPAPLDGKGIQVNPGTSFAIDRRADDRAIRICFGGKASREELRQALLPSTSCSRRTPQNG